MPEQATVTGVTQSLDQAVYEVDGAGPAELFEALADAAVDVDSIVQIGSSIVFASRLADGLTTASALDALGAVWSEHGRLARISVIGVEMKGGIVAKAFRAMRDARLEPQFSSTSPVRISFYVPLDDADRAVDALHDAFELEQEPRGA